MTHNLFIPASVDQDSVPGLLDGWSGPIKIECDGRLADGVAHYDGGRAFTDALLFGENAPNAGDEPAHLDARRHEVRTHVVEVLGRGVECHICKGEHTPFCSACHPDSPHKGYRVPSHDLRWALSWGPLTPSITEDESAEILAHAVAMVRAGKQPPQRLLDRWKLWGSAGCSPGEVRWDRAIVAGSGGAESAWLKRGQRPAGNGGLDEHAAYRTDDGLVLPWPDDATPLRSTPHPDSPP